MYVSDYGFAASPSAWTSNVGSYDSSSITGNNWMYMGLVEWTISRDSSQTDRAYRVNNSGYVYSYGVYSSGPAVRPCFYVTSNVTYVGGTGTKSNPIRIN